MMFGFGLNKRRPLSGEHPGAPRRQLRLESLERREMLAYVEFETNFGLVHARTLDSRVAQDFVRQIDRGDYDGTIFHRLIPEATLSTGRYDIDGNPVPDGGNSTTSFSVPNTRGAIAAIPVEGTNKFSGSWFINLADNPHLDAAGYMVIGYVDSDDMHIVDAIASLPTFDIRGHESVPLRDFELQDPPQLPGPEHFVVIHDARRTPVNISVYDGQVVEGDVGQTIGFVFAWLSIPSDSMVEFRYATSDGSARHGDDYREAVGITVLNPGETGKAILVPIHGDGAFESNETIRIRISNVSGATLFDDEAFLTILNDDRGVSGDTNLDNVVDIIDVNNIRNHFGYAGTEFLGDVTDDQLVGIDDLNAVRNNFGATATLPANPVMTRTETSPEAASFSADRTVLSPATVNTPARYGSRRKGDVLSAPQDVLHLVDRVIDEPEFGPLRRHARRHR